ncbi:MAG: PspC domain-containing protein [Bacteroidia bacterium]|nr:PspC domain-containing protein [Bacteroidia bacterium]
METKKLRKGENKVLLGVCSGLGIYFNLDPVLVRALFLLAFLGFGTGLLLYIILAIVMPSADTA